MPKSNSYDATYDSLIDQDQMASQWAESELVKLLERESGQYLDQFTELPDILADGVERFTSDMLGSIARDKYNDPNWAYQMTTTLIEYIVAGTFNGKYSQSTPTYPAGRTRHGIESIADTGIQIGVYHTTVAPDEHDWTKTFSEASMARNEDTMRLLGTLAKTMGTENDIDLSFIENLPVDDQPTTITELVSGDQVLATLHRATHDIDIIVRPIDSQQIQKVA